MDRVNELGDASVPFRFDVHTLCFSEDAVSLEAALHKPVGLRRARASSRRRCMKDSHLEWRYSSSPET